MAWLEADHVFYATQENKWNYNANDLFKGLEGIAYSTDDGQDWHEVNKGFPAPLGNLSWVIRGRGGFYADGYVYAIATERSSMRAKSSWGAACPESST
ncbi:MAG: hypothetical protein M3Y17_01180 [Actinomycetota bacterium]|nr:hypothetical protein [Actinomycetota bacterium]